MRKNFFIRWVNKISSSKPLLVQLTVLTWISQFDIHCLQLGWKWLKKYYTESTTVAVRLFASNPTYIYCLQHTVFLPLATSIFFFQLLPVLNSKFCSFSASLNFLFPKAIITKRGNIMLLANRHSRQKNICIKTKSKTKNLKRVICDKWQHMCVWRHKKLP